MVSGPETAHVQRGDYANYFRNGDRFWGNESISMKCFLYFFYISYFDFSMAKFE